MDNDTGNKEGLDLNATMWQNTVLCSGMVLGLVIQVGPETRMSMNMQANRSKVGSLDHELNFLSKILFLFMVIIGLF